MENSKMSLVDAKRTGAACEICGMKFVMLKDYAPYSHGHPTVCHGCWKTLTGFEKRLHRRAKRDTAVRQYNRIIDEKVLAIKLAPF